MLKLARSYEEACRTFRWRLPERYNVAFDVCDRQTMAGADGHRTALIVEAADGTVERYTFHVLRLLSNRLANVLTAAGMRPGDRVAVSLPQGVEAAVTALAVLKMGAVLVPLPLGLGREPLLWRLADSGARMVVADPVMARRIETLRERLPGLLPVLATGESSGDGEGFWDRLEAARDGFSPALTALDDGAILQYPADPMGTPAGALHGHGAVLGALPALELGLGFFPQFGDLLWSSADWMGPEGFLWSLLPSWHHGVPVLAWGKDFSAPGALELMARHGIRAAWLPPLHMAELAAAASSLPHALPRALMAGPGAIDPALPDQVRQVFGVPLGQVWGTVFSGPVVAGHAAVVEQRDGSPGRAAPGVTVEALDRLGRVLRAGEPGELALAPGTPCGATAIWRNGQAQPRRLVNGWLPCGAVGVRDLDGWLWCEEPPCGPDEARIDGLRIGLDEAEACLAAHPAVARAALACTPQGELKAFVVPRPGLHADVHLAQSLQQHLAEHRSRAEVPRRVEFMLVLDSLPDGRPDRQALATRQPVLTADPADRFGQDRG